MEDGPYCNGCKYLIGVRAEGLAGAHRYYKDTTDWRCGHLNNVFDIEDEENGWKIDVVLGIRYRLFKIDTNIRTIRTEHCKGSWYEKYMPPVRTESRTIGGQEGTEIVFDNATLEANRKAAEDKIKSLRQKRLGSLANIDAKEL